MNGLTPAALATMGGILALLVLATAITEGLARRRSGEAITNLRLRVRTWWRMVAVFVAALLVGRTFAFLFLALRIFFSW
jgi:phosphatidate cytidylyltransferase